MRGGERRGGGEGDEVDVGGGGGARGVPPFFFFFWGAGSVFGWFSPPGPGPRASRQGGQPNRRWPLCGTAGDAQAAGRPPHGGGGGRRVTSKKKSQGGGEGVKGGASFRLFFVLFFFFPSLAPFFPPSRPRLPPRPSPVLFCFSPARSFSLFLLCAGPRSPGCSSVLLPSFLRVLSSPSFAVICVPPSSTRAGPAVPSGAWSRCPLAFMPGTRCVPPPSELRPDAHEWHHVRALDPTEYKVCGAIIRARKRSPLIVPSRRNQAWPACSKLSRCGLARPSIARLALTANLASSSRSPAYAITAGRAKKPDAGRTKKPIKKDAPL